MASQSVFRVVIQHVAGAKANQIEQIPLADRIELRLGRDPASDIAFDPVRDDVVSRHHATIKIIDGDQISFRLTDNKSSNGTFLNGERISDEKELLPQDAVNLGANGPKFIFDVQPRPANLGVRTRVIDVPNEATTRVVSTNVAPTVASTIRTAAWTAAPENQSPPPPPPPPPPPQGIGKETLLREIQKESGKSTRVLKLTLAGVGALAVAIGGLVFWRENADQRAQQAAIKQIREETAAREEELSRRNERDVDATETALKRRIGVSPQQIVQDYGNAMARVQIQWRLYDQQTGKPVFQQTTKHNKETLRDYVRVVVDGETKIVPWLTLDDSQRTNVAIMGDIFGTGFVVEEHGYLLTAKHLALGWTERFNDGGDNRYGFLWDYKGGPDAKKSKPLRIDLDDPAYEEARRWAPTDGGYIFTPHLAYTWGRGGTPDAKKDDHRIFAGRNDIFEVRFPNSLAPVNASLVRGSNDSDAALIKVDTPQRLKSVVLAEESSVEKPIVSAGEKVFVLGFPGIALKTLSIKEVPQGGGMKTLEEVVPKPFISEGIVSLVTPKLKSENLVTTMGEKGEMLQLSINSAGAGNSGGPVFNSEGKVIGLYVWRISGGGANNSGAVPIRYGQELMRFQRE
jgi:pSer/pThr/pTyr-binding forkhead associated (FHA) protein/S1-C subfamily serine protease